MMREHIAGRSGLRAENILIAASHTHAAPAAMSLYQTPAASEGEIEQFLKKAAEAVIEAERGAAAGGVEGGAWERVVGAVQPAAAVPGREDAP